MPIFPASVACFALGWLSILAGCDHFIPEVRDGQGYISFRERALKWRAAQNRHHHWRGKLYQTGSRDARDFDLTYDPAGEFRLRVFSPGDASATGAVEIALVNGVRTGGNADAPTAPDPPYLPLATLLWRMLANRLVADAAVIAPFEAPQGGPVLMLYRADNQIIGEIHADRESGWNGRETFKSKWGNVTIRRPMPEQPESDGEPQAVLIELSTPAGVHKVELSITETVRNGPAPRNR